jgi:hypothetical protein
MVAGAIAPGRSGSTELSVARLLTVSMCPLSTVPDPRL